MKKFLASSFIMLGLITNTFATAVSKNSTIGYRSSILFFIKNPSHTKNIDQSYKYYKDGVLYVENGIIKDVGAYATISPRYKKAKIVDYRGKLIIPGFIDSHVHYPQLEMIGSYGEQLLDWLKKYTFPTEHKYNNSAYAQRKASDFMGELINNGTTSAAIYATTSPNSVNAIFSEALKRNMRIISGKVLMDRNAPEYLIDTPDIAYSESKSLIKKWHKKARLLYAVTPRFAITSSAEELQVAKKLLDEFPTVYLQTHLAENKDEVEYVKNLFPGMGSYLDVYNHFGLVRKHSIFGHSIYLGREDFKLLHDHGSSIAFCPTSNLFLGSGLFNLSLAEKYHVKIGLGTDVGAGTSLSLLQTMAEAYKVVQMQKVYKSDADKQLTLNPFSAFYYATLGAAKALDIDSYVGTFKSGNEADFIVLNTNSPKTLKQKVSNDQTIQDLLFSIMMLGDDRTVEHVYIMGKLMK